MNINKILEYHPEKHKLTHILTTCGENILQNLRYDYDGFSNLASRKDEERDMEETFTYDHLNRLTGIWRNSFRTGWMDYDAYGRMTRKVVDNLLVFTNAVYDETAKPHAIDRADTDLQVFAEHAISYTSFDKVKRIEQDGNTLEYTYGYDRQRIFMEEHVGDTTRTKRYLGNCELLTVTTDTDTVSTQWLTYLAGPTGVYAVVTTDAEGTHTIHYVLKDNLGSWTTITDRFGNVEQQLSYDAWGTLRDPDTWQNYSVAEPVEAPMFDRGFTGHEHLYAFGLINMNGRIYDPQMSSFLSVDAYVQSPDNAQSFNRYAYCQNNPLRYVDPSGWYMQGASYGTPVTGSSWGESYSQHAYEWREICDAGARDAVADTLLTSFICGGGGGCIISGNFLFGEDGRIEDINNIAIYCNSRFDKQELLVMPTATSGRCVLIGLGGAKKYWYCSTKKYADGTKKWDEKAKLFMKVTGKTFNTNIQDLIEFIEWNDEKEAFSNYEASIITINQIPEALLNDYVVAACVSLKNKEDIRKNEGSEGHFANVSMYLSTSNGVEIGFIEPIGTNFMETYKATQASYYEDQPFLNACVFIKYKFLP